MAHYLICRELKSIRRWSKWTSYIHVYVYNRRIFVKHSDWINERCIMVSRKFYYVDWIFAYICIVYMIRQQSFHLRFSIVLWIYRCKKGRALGALERSFVFEKTLKVQNQEWSLNEEMYCFNNFKSRPNVCRKCDDRSVTFFIPAYAGAHG